MVNLLLAVEPRVPRGALAEVTSVGVVSTAAAVGAGAVGTRHGTQLAVVAIETVRTSAGICVFQVLLDGKKRKWNKLARKRHRWIKRGLTTTDVAKVDAARRLTVQLPPLRQGFPAHSLTWVSQLAPVKPGLQEQV